MQRTLSANTSRTQVDADANNVHITIDGPVVTVRDDGHGMDFDTLRRARRLGASDKGRQFNVGFRGIGIYAAFGMCEALTIHTHQADTSELLGLTMRFGEMCRVLERDRNAPRRSSIALTDLLFEHTDFLRTNFTGNLNDQFTMVRLEGIQPEYRSQLSNLSEVHGYLLNTLPVLFPDTGYGPDVNQWMRDRLDLNPVRVSSQGRQRPRGGCSSTGRYRCSRTANYLSKGCRGTRASIYVVCLICYKGSRFGGSRNGGWFRYGWVPPQDQRLHSR